VTRQDLQIKAWTHVEMEAEMATVEVYVAAGSLDELAVVDFEVVVAVQLATAVVVHVVVLVEESSVVEWVLYRLDIFVSSPTSA